MKAMPLKAKVTGGGTQAGLGRDFSKKLNTNAEFHAELKNAILFFLFEPLEASKIAYEVWEETTCGPGQAGCSPGIFRSIGL